MLFNPKIFEFKTEKSYFIGSGIQVSSSLVKNKLNDEQAALGDLVNQMANNVIDVNMAHNTQTLDAAELQERAFEYGRQLQIVSSKLAHKYSHLRNKAELFQDQGQSAFNSELISANDKMLISEVAARAREANSEFRLEPVPNLIGIFGQYDKSDDEESAEDIEDENDLENVRQDEQNSDEDEDESS